MGHPRRKISVGSLVRARQILSRMYPVLPPSRETIDERLDDSFRKFYTADRLD